MTFAKCCYGIIIFHCQDCIFTSSLCFHNIVLMPPQYYAHLCCHPPFKIKSMAVALITNNLFEFDIPVQTLQRCHNMKQSMKQPVTD